jgi:hypothetical protein
LHHRESTEVEEEEEEEDADYLKEVTADKVLLKSQFQPFFLLPITFMAERRCPTRTRKDGFLDADVHPDADVHLVADDK